MANLLVVTKNYNNGEILLEADLDNIKSDLETFFNTTGLTGDNIKASSITGDVVNDNLLDGTTLEFDADRKITIVDESIVSSKLAVGDPGLPVGGIEFLHEYSGTIDVPRGWMYANGNVINQTNYDAIHGAGAYVADGISSSSVDGETLPNLNSGEYIVGTTSASGGSIGSLFKDYDHSHIIVDYDGSNARTYDSGGNLDTLTNAAVSAPYTGILANTTGAYPSVDFDMHTDNLVSSTIIAQPAAVYLAAIVRVI